MNNITNLTDEQLIKIGWEEGQPDTLCEVCVDHEMITEASHYSHNTEMCFDCYQEVNE